MHISNRMENVNRLRCNACQDFLKLIIRDGWQQIVYDKAETEITSNGSRKAKYIEVYGKMREIGVENFRVEDMDVTFISELIHGCKEIVPTDIQTRKAIEQLTEDKNKFQSHDSKNEKEELLYQRGFLSLCNLETFIETVDVREQNIDDEARRKFREIYSSRIKDLKEKLDEERILLVQKNNDIESDIRKILESKDMNKTWYEVSKIYMERYWVLEKDYDHYFNFIIKASDAEIVEAHSVAADIYLNIKKDYVEGEKRLFMIFDSIDKLTVYQVKEILDTINLFLLHGNTVTEGMAEMVNRIIKQGYSVEKSNNGLYILGNKT